jgi:hypothetical protein
MFFDRYYQVMTIALMPRVIESKWIDFHRYTNEARRLFGDSFSDGEGFVFTSEGVSVVVCIPSAFVNEFYRIFPVFSNMARIPRELEIVVYRYFLGPNPSWEDLRRVIDRHNSSSSNEPFTAPKKVVSDDFTIGWSR